MVKKRLAAVIVSAILAAVCASQAGAVQIETSSTLNPVGSGARATGMGGAFIGVADDATAASWNPAGLIQLERPEASFVYSYFDRRQDYSSGAHPEMESKNEKTTHGVNYASVALPFVAFNRNMIVSVNYQRLYEMDKFVAYDYRTVLSSTRSLAGGTTVSTTTDITENREFEQKGYLYALAPAFAVQVLPNLYLGATLNFWDDVWTDNGWEGKFKSHGNGTITISTTRRGRTSTTVMDYENRSNFRNRFDFSGINMNFGVMWNISDKFTLGAVYKTPFDADLSQHRDSRTETYINNVLNSTSHQSSYEELTMHMPASYGVGVQYRHNDAWTVALDLYRTEWSRFRIKDEDGKEWNPATVAPLKDGRLDDTVQVRLGTEYLFIKDKYVIPVRAGLFYDPEPQTRSLDDYYGFSLGTGYSRGRFAFDVSYQYRFANNVSSDIPFVPKHSVDVRQQTLMASVIFYFK